MPAAALLSASSERIGERERESEITLLLIIRIVYAARPSPIINGRCAP